MADERTESRARREEVKVFRSSLDKRTISTTLFTQPSFYMALGNMALMYITHRFPEEFLPPRYLSMSYNGLKASSMLAIPFCAISGFYFSIASIVSASPDSLGGHLYGFTVSTGVGLGMMGLRRVSWYYPLLGAAYLAFGGLHHYRRLMLYGDNAPLMCVSDMREIWSDIRGKKQTDSS
ncbi:hypothetical protein STCU_01387 [Strigomonas culicis]|uniref:Transmembrane protein n=1 Tax=Strigomonas culicis TaxID=28005 RepID=S9VW45_9TRYP|nr:hypothetical protein STCU_05917 [Strigomonas culicis]EPY27890.1 hypothetical protein STCU_05448 [Strigomonas culicis]EPY31256.1 hypothetical protein STCU_03545 [Strigomonas culicis]EPY34715.1 hypothetical protein STCU_01387 [Strigomonas culicis]|eukprot:EPY27108.1 hypothetical protein STCU_05917 [Strigomonas culicis]